MTARFQGLAPRTIAGVQVDPLGFQTLEADLQALADLVRFAAEGAQPGAMLHIVEIGSWVGETALAMAEACGARPARITCIDTWEGSPGNITGHITAEVGAQQIYNRFLQNTLAYRTAGNPVSIAPLRGRSPFVSGEFPNQSLDLVFIDGDHRWKAVEADVRAWLPKVRLGGIIAGHDWDEVEVPVRATGLTPLKTGDSVWSQVLIASPEVLLSKQR